MRPALALLASALALPATAAVAPGRGWEALVKDVTSGTEEMVVRPAAPVALQEATPPTYAPIILWHGMGDSCCAESMTRVKQWLDELLPGVYVHSVMVGNSLDDDVSAGFFGQVWAQIDDVCAKLAADPVIAAAPRVLGIGFSQGGQFLRALAQRCEGVRVARLVTFGAQHMGVARAPGCSVDDATPDPRCLIMRDLLRSGGYAEWVQRRSVQAQYFRDPKKLGVYREKSLFLAAANNEREEKVEGFRERVRALERFVMVRFGEETTVVPAESSWFGYVDENNTVVPMREQQLYKEDWLGLKTLDEAGKIYFLETNGSHMQIRKEFFDEVVRTHLTVPVVVGAGGEKVFRADDVDLDEDDDCGSRMGGASVEVVPVVEMRGGVLEGRR
ncbi:hypothetical protein HDU96_002133, partial [Phlyctochytrium bullatum]